MFFRAKALAHPLSWHDPVTGWTLPLPKPVQEPAGQHITLHQWALQEFELQIVGHRGSVPLQACSIPIGLKIPLELAVLATSLYPARKRLEKAFGKHVFCAYSEEWAQPATALD